MTSKTDRNGTVPPSARRSRAYRAARNLHRAAVLILGTTLFALVNVLAWNFKVYWRMPEANPGISSRASSMLDSIKGEIDVKVLLPRKHRAFEPLRQLLSNLRDVANAQGNAKLRIEYIDPQRDLGRAAQMTQQYGFTGWNVVFSTAERVEVVKLDEMLENVPSKDADFAVASSEATRFRGEQLCVTALMRLMHPRTQKIYALAGNGERDFDSYDPLSGYASLAREIRLEGYRLENLRISNSHGIPADCDLLIIAGPRYYPSPETQAAIEGYLSGGGRMLLMLDRFDQIPSGWEGILKRLGLGLSNLSVVGSRTVSGSHLIVDRFGSHPTTRDLGRSTVFFITPQVIDLLEDNGAFESERPRIEIVVAAPDNSWAEANPEILPHTYNPEVDRKGVLPLVVAVQIGVNMGTDVVLKTMRTIVVGDSNCGVNSIISGGRTGNRDLILNMVNWLTESSLPMASSLMAESEVLQLGMSRNRQLRLFQHTVIYWPLAVVVIGLSCVAIRRR